MKKAWIATGILLLYALVISFMTFMVVYLYNQLADDSIFGDAAPWIKLFVSGFPMLEGFAVFTALASIGIKRVYMSEMHAQRINGQQMKGVSR